MSFQLDKPKLSFDCHLSFFNCNLFTKIASNLLLQLLKFCHEEFGIMPPNNIVKDCCTVNDFIAYYEKKRRPGIIPEIWRLQNQKLPRNLSFEAPLPMKRA